MTFNLELFNQQLSAFGTLEYSSVVPTDVCECLEFVCGGINDTYTLANISNFLGVSVLPYFPVLITVSVDGGRIKCAFKRMIV
jgi:hypothetical protein